MVRPFEAFELCYYIPRRVRPGTLECIILTVYNIIKKNNEEFLL